MSWFVDTPAYKSAIARGDIYDDEWVADCCSPTDNEKK